MSKPIKLEIFTETLERYKKFYPENCVGRDDIDILVYRGLITENQAYDLRNPMPKKGRVLAHADLSKIDKVKRMTEKQFIKACKEAAADWQADNPDRHIEEVAYDLAEALLFMDDGKFSGYLNKIGIEKQFHKEALAEYIC